ncbi:urease accessory protein UreF [Chitinophaga sp. 212800010-3]|uniref:urease accessory protein UreF n=1 Tax=unclassified Chitinophaga TaxID=2619133 RepID=UPI002DEF47A4|nr:Urease accessory protein UreF [Chitinophaga sp. 212800010-3]
MMHPFLSSLLHLSDPTLPIGGYVHSNGLETYVQQGIVHNAATAHAFVQQMLTSNLQYNDGAFVCLAYRATVANDQQEMLRLDEEAGALKLPKEIRQASQKLGVRLMKIFDRRHSNSFTAAYAAAIADKKAEGHYSLAYGMYAAVMNIPLEEALLAFYYNAAVGMVTNAVKLVPLGQLEGQDILFDLQPMMNGLVQSTMQIDRDLVGVCNIGFDIRCMQHEKLYSRLYMS